MMLPEIRRKLYKRGSSYETTIPPNLLFEMDTDKEYNVMFVFSNEKRRWYVEFEEISGKKGKK